MASTPDRKIIVRRSYQNDYVQLLRPRVRDRRDRLGLSRQKFLYDEVLERLSKLEGDVVFEDGSACTFDDETGKQIIDWIDIKQVERFETGKSSSNSKTVATHGPALIRAFDAYVQATVPKFLEMIMAPDDLSKMGEIVGYFLRDPRAGVFDYIIAQAKQKILHFYQYDNVDSAGQYDGETRYLCLFAGETNDYLFALDFAFAGNRFAPLEDERLRLYYGFCAPGEYYSPIVMRSYCLRERLAGVIYPPSKLVGVASEALEQLRFEVSTTDNEFHVKSVGDNDSERGVDEVFLRALKDSKGLRLVRSLRKVEHNSEKYKTVKSRTDRFLFDYIW